MGRHDAQESKAAQDNHKEIKMKTEKPEQLISDKSDPRAEALTDLSVTDEQAEQAKGGFDSLGRLLIGTEGGTY
jgi:hypothetical protein